MIQIILLSVLAAMLITKPSKILETPYGSLVLAASLVLVFIGNLTLALTIATVFCIYAVLRK